METDNVLYEKLYWKLLEIRVEHTTPRTAMFLKVKAKMAIASLEDSKNLVDEIFEDMMDTQLVVSVLKKYRLK